MERQSIAVSGMACPGCEQNVENALGTLEGVTRVDADHEGSRVDVVVDDTVADDDLHSTIEQAGYDVPS